MAKQKIHKPTAIETVNVGAAAVDISSREHMAAVNPDVTHAPVRAFGTFSHDLHDLAEWFKTHGVTNVAMESTGVYWIPAYEILEQHGFEVILVNARYAKNVPGRKTDVSDASWLRQLHSYGLLRGSFRPSAEIATLRAYLRQRERLVEYAAAHIQYIQKALMEMNLQLHHFVSDITGVTGMKIIRAIAAGERDLDGLASHRDVRCRATVETIKAALNVNDRHLESTLAELGANQDHVPNQLPRPSTKTKQVSTPSIDVRAALFGVLGVDLTEIHGMGPSLSLKLVGECGTDLRGWPRANTSRHGCVWHRATKYQVERCCRLGRDGHRVAPLPFTIGRCYNRAKCYCS